MTLPTLSASKLKTFEDCQNRYYYRYIEHMPDTKTVHAVLGTSFHKAIELYYKKGFDPYQTYKSNWEYELKEFGLQHDNQCYYDGLDMIEIYPFNERRPSDQELPFTLKFPNKEAPICQIRGYIDQIYADTKMVCDLKTAKRKPSARVLDTDPQFILYAWACEQIFGYAPTIIWYHARTGEPLVANVGGEEKLALVTKTIHDVLTFHENPHAELREKTCFFCPYVAQCKGA